MSASIMKYYSVTRHSDSIIATYDIAEMIEKDLKDRCLIKKGGIFGLDLS